MTEAQAPSRAWVAERFEGIVSELRQGRDAASLWAEASGHVDEWLGFSSASGTRALSLLVEMQCALTGDGPTVVMHAVRQMLGAGQQEYSGESNAFEQFEQAGAALGITAAQVLRVYAHKHAAGITHWAAGVMSQREDVTGRVLDLMVYLVLDQLMAEAGGL